MQFVYFYSLLNIKLARGWYILQYIAYLKYKMLQLYLVFWHISTIEFLLEALSVSCFVNS